LNALGWNLVSDHTILPIRTSVPPNTRLVVARLNSDHFSFGLPEYWLMKQRCVRI
jgi:hypothetical protein